MHTEPTIEVCPWCGQGEVAATGVDATPGLVLCRTCRDRLHPEVLALLTGDEEIEVTTEYVPFTEDASTSPFERTRGSA